MPTALKSACIFYSIGELISLDHRARTTWDAVGEVHLSALQEPSESWQFVQGRRPTSRR